ncbi:MAG: DUF2797 domain-containing protein [Flavobacteriia bacterium]
METQGYLRKMHVDLGDTISYRLNLDSNIKMNDLLGKKIKFTFLNEIQCVSCGKKTSKSFNQGFCYSCFIEAPESAECIIRPELCRAHLGEGRDVEWEQAHHNQPHVVYLAASDVVKVGVTRTTQMPTRWIDQGANSAIILAETPNRYLAGVLEVELKNHFSDKTNWQKMLKNVIDDSIDLVDTKWSLEEVLPQDLMEYFSEDDTIFEFNYPVTSYPETIKSLSFDKEIEIEGILTGIKGQYIYLDTERVLNIRKHTGYKISIKIM